MNTLFWHKLADDVYLDLSKWWFVIKKKKNYPWLLHQSAETCQCFETTNDVMPHALELEGFRTRE